MNRPCLGRGPNGEPLPLHPALPGTSRCALHPWKGTWATTSPESRGYGAAWKRLRLHILERDNYTCVLCAKRGLYATATDVDHITPKSQGGTNDRANLRALCGPCHDAKTKRERRAARKASRA